MKKKQLKIQIDEDVEARLHQSGARFGLSGNAVLAVAAYELSRVRPENLFHALGRIAAGEAVELIAPGAGAQIEAKKPARRALPVT